MVRHPGVELAFRIAHGAARQIQPLSIRVVDGIARPFQRRLGQQVVGDRPGVAGVERRLGAEVRTVVATHVVADCARVRSREGALVGAVVAGLTHQGHRHLLPVLLVVGRVEDRVRNVFGRRSDGVFAVGVDYDRSARTGGGIADVSEHRRRPGQAGASGGGQQQDGAARPHASVSSPVKDAASFCSIRPTTAPSVPASKANFAPAVA